MTSTLRRRKQLELHLGAFSLRIVPGSKPWLRIYREEACHHHCWKTAPARIEGLRRLIESLSLDSDAILGALKLRLKVAEVGRRFELRIVFGDDQQVRQRRRQSLLRLLIPLEGCRILGDVRHRGGCDLADLGAPP